MSRRHVTVATVLVLASFVILLSTRLSQSAGPGGQKVCAGPQTCECCHEDVFKAIQSTEMGRLFLKHARTPEEGLVCETCHGSGKEHADSDGKSFKGLVGFTANSTTPMEERSAACLSCHEKRNRLFWQGSAHPFRDVGCTSCHKVHRKATDPLDHKLLIKGSETETCKPCHQQAVAQQLRFSRHPVNEGKMECSSCHNVHGTVGDRLLKADTVNELCYKCHTEKRGPHLFEHPPVLEDCGNCHVPHGSNYPRLLKLPESRLCRLCHTSFHSVPFKGRNLDHAIGRLCTDCHFNVHGSNHPSGYYFTR